MNKKAQSTGKLGAIAVFIILGVSLLLIIPGILRGVIADNTNLCESNTTFPRYNSSLDLCLDSINNLTAGNVSATDNLNTTETTVLGIVFIMILLGFVVGILVMAGITKKN